MQASSFFILKFFIFGCSSLHLYSPDFSFKLKVAQHGSSIKSSFVSCRHQAWLKNKKAPEGAFLFAA
ncbi:hypothetical protein D7V32_10145 [Acinetobacter tianfuensis]|uniref:Uncharacterized protein n=1 Tax=Acinetobacter tianfuensis TaxID=2419603 RepID=A0A3A8EPN1_9GAMM|nr:hypothetical protein D7V32_10145 [Acinetobacter tianfuensis]